MQVLLTLLLAGAALFVLLSGSYADGHKWWAFIILAELTRRWFAVG